MTISSILSSPSQRKNFLLVSIGVIIVCIVIIFAIAKCTENGPMWSALNNILISVVSSAIFALVAGAFIYYFFVVLHDEHERTVVLPADIDRALIDIAASAHEYKIYVRTGRYFRSRILPILIERAKTNRSPLQLTVILLNCENKIVCKRYADYRQTYSFDRKVWNELYVQKQILSTVMALIQAADQISDVSSIRLFLSDRLSAFRIEGSDQQIMITREDPKDSALRYSRNHRDFGAFMTEFNWISQEATHLQIGGSGGKHSLIDIFGDQSPLLALEPASKKSLNDESPYAR